MRSIAKVSKGSWGRVAIRAAIALQLLVVSAGAASAQVLFNNTNTGGVGNQPYRTTTFTLRTFSRVDEVQTYH